MKTILKIQITLAVLLAAFASIAQAKDVSAQQAGVEYARQEVERADAQHKANIKEVADATKLLEQRKKAYEEQIKQLLTDRKKAELSKQHLQEANEKFNKAQAILDQAWKE
jgi:hypothetical protein